MARKDGTQEGIDRAQESGRKNRDLWPSVQNWCATMDLRDISRGVLHQVFGNPTAVRLSCIHASGAVGGSDLDALAANFIRTNCIACPHQREIVADNFGRKTLAEAQKELQSEQEQKAKERRVQELLKSQIEQLVDSAKKRTPPPGLSILKLIDDLETTHDPDSVAHQILEASLLEPSFFTAEAIDALALYYRNESWGAKIVLATANLIAANRPFSPFCKELAFQALQKGLHPEQLAALALAAADFQVFSAWRPWIEAILEGLNYLMMLGYRDPQQVSRAQREHFIARWLPAHESAVIELLTPRLLCEEKLVRINTCRLVKEIHHNFSDKGLQLCPILFQAFELVDSDVLESADYTSRELLASIIIASGRPGIDAFFSHLAAVRTEAAWLAAWPVLTFLMRTADAGDSKLTDDLATELPSGITNKEYSWKVREAIVDTLQALVKRGNSPTRLFTSLLGSLSTLNEEKTTFKWYQEQLKAGKSTTFNPLLAKSVWDIDAEEMYINRARENVIDLLADELRRAPDLYYPEFCAVLTALDSQLAAGYKTDILVVAMKGLDSPRQIALYIPHLYTFLFDPYVVDIRIQSMHFLRKVVEDFPELVNDPLLGIVDAFQTDSEKRIRAEVLTIIGSIAESEKFQVTEQHINFVLVSLKEKWVIVLNRAVLTSRIILPLMAPTQVAELSGWLSAFSRPKENGKIDDLGERSLSVLLDITIDYPRTLPYVVQQHIVPLCSSPDRRQAEKYIGVLGEIQEKHPEYSDPWLTGILHYLTISRREFFGSMYDERDGFFANLSTLPPDLIGRRRADILSAARTIVKIDPIDAVNFIFVLAEFEEWDAVLAICREIEGTIAVAKANEALLNRIAIIKGLTESMSMPAGGAALNDLRAKINDIKNELSKAGA